VAVVEELCVALTSEPEKELPVPELEGILIASNGAVMLSNGRGGTKGASAAGRTLHALLSTANVPVALRLFVTQASSPDRYSSIREFAAALAYYGKPGRADLIRAVYQRCAAPGVAASPEPIDRAPEPAIQSEPDINASKPPQRKAPMWAPVAVAMVGVLGAGMWLWSTIRGTGESTGPSLMTSAKSAIQELHTEVREVLGVGAPPVSRGGKDPATSSPPRASRRRATRPRASGTRASKASPVVTAVTSRLDPEPVVTLADQGVPVQSSASVDSAEEPETPVPVYSSTDLDVRPPILIRPQLPPPLVAERRAGAVNSMELLVSESGAVLQVRIVEGPRRLPDMMLLSGAKMWKFQPAVKDGDPVRYRTVVSWSGIP
jgi:hypothetical protein